MTDDEEQAISNQVQIDTLITSIYQKMYRADYYTKPSRQGNMRNPDSQYPYLDDPVNGAEGYGFLIHEGLPE